MENPFAIKVDGDTLKKRLFAQDPLLIKTAQRLAEKIRAMPKGSAESDGDPRVFIVGGFVRDVALGLEPKDMDVEVYGVSPKELESVLEQLFPGRVNAVGQSFGVLKIRLEEGLEFDVSIPRTESKIGTGHKGFAIQSDPSLSVVEAARRRDFTINALSADPLTGEFVDPFGGLADVKNRILRVTDPEHFAEDPLRVYRAAQFVARMELAVDPDSRELMKGMVERGETDALSADRIREEWRKLLLKGKRPSMGLEVMREVGLIERDYPELHALIGLEQNPEWHPEGDVWTHTKMVLDQAVTLSLNPERGFSDQEREVLMYGALCHDLGKATTTTTEQDGRIRSLGHTEAGVEPAVRLLKRLHASNRLTDQVPKLVAQHMAPKMLVKTYQDGKMSEKAFANAVRKLLKKIDPLPIGILLAVSEADWRGSWGATSEPEAEYEVGTEIRKIMQGYQLETESPQNLLQGKDLIALGIAPGPEMGEWIKKIEALRDAGEIETKEEALEVVRRERQS